MLSFYDFPSWVFLFFLIALAVTIFFYSRKFLRIFDALEMEKREQVSKPRKKQLQGKGMGVEKGKIRKAAPKLESRSRKLDKKLPDFYKSRPPKDASNRMNLPRNRDSIASISSLGSIIRFADYQDSDLSSIVSSDPINDSEIFPYFLTDHTTIVYQELNPPNKKVNGPNDDTSKSKERMMSIPAFSMGLPDHRRVDESKIFKSQARVMNHPPKLLQCSSTRTQLDRVPEVMVKTCTSVEEVITKNESFVERMRFTKNLEPKRTRDIP